jgi:hypothetical protein
MVEESECAMVGCDPPVEDCRSCDRLLDRSEISAFWREELTDERQRFRLALCGVHDADDGEDEDPERRDSDEAAERVGENPTDCVDDYPRDEEGHALIRMKLGKLRILGGEEWHEKQQPDVGENRHDLVGFNITGVVDDFGVAHSNHSSGPYRGSFRDKFRVSGVELKRILDQRA